MKKILCAIVLILSLCAAFFLGNAPALAEQPSALTDVSLIFKEEVYLRFSFNQNVINQEKGNGKQFSFSLTYPEKTYTESDLVWEKDPISGISSPSLTVGPFSMTAWNYPLQYSGTMTESKVITLTQIAKEQITK